MPKAREGETRGIIPPSHKVGRSKPGVVLTSGFNGPGQYVRGGQYWSIEKLSGRWRVLAVI